jgi:hypothetical protein
MDLRTLNTLKVGDRIRITRDDKDVGTRAGDLGTVTAIARAPEAPVFPTVYVRIDGSHPDVQAWDDELMLSPEYYSDVAAPNEGIDSRIDPNSIVAGMEKADMLRTPVDEQGLRWRAGKAEAA